MGTGNSRNANLTNFNTVAGVILLDPETTSTGAKRRQSPGAQVRRGQSEEGK